MKKVKKTDSISTRKPRSRTRTGKKSTGNVAPPILYVAVGASAGGLEAIEAFFSGMTPKNGLAFIVIQHLSPDYKSLMVEILSKKTAMNVCRAEDGMRVAPNHVYLIPPKKNLTIFHGKLHLEEQPQIKGSINLPIDVFLRSLAEDQGDKSVAVILSGSGSDGMRGVRAIKEHGGMVMVQKEDTARFDSMPRAAISTGLADFILPPGEMPGRLLAYASHPYVAKAERDSGEVGDEDALTRIFSILRDKFQVDFSQYKASTVNRRIERRMSVNRIEDIRDYMGYVQSYPGEAMFLYRELLIGVTRFFRDRDIFDAVSAKWLGDVLARRDTPELRFWAAGCSTGEEAYSLAILIRECMLREGVTKDVKIFATDIDQDALHYAANGIYPESIAADVPPDLLKKYFFRHRESYQVARTIRELVVFARHNLIKDPPFTRIDMISCRNLLIYLQPVSQLRVLEFFNFSLNPGGVLLLGNSETVGEMTEYFKTLDQKSRIYRSYGRTKAKGGGPVLYAADERRLDHAGWRATHRAPRESDDRLLERLLETLKEDIPLAVVVNEEMDVLHVVGDSEGYLKLPSGKRTLNISKMAVKELAVPLSTGIQKVFRKHEALRFSNIRLRQEDGRKVVDLRIKPLARKKDQEPLVVVLLTENRKTVPASEQADQNYDLSHEAEQRIADLEQELQVTRENLQATVEELETSNEELQATNEELLASNEELQSTNEELQSTNEELYSVNSEYQSKIMELGEMTNDVDNLLSASQIGKILLDENMEVRRFSRSVTEIFKLLDADVGRPLTHIPHHLVKADPVRDIEGVLKSGVMAEQEVQTSDGNWYLMRVIPYVVGPEVFSGVVVSFVNITRLMQAEEDLRIREEQFRVLYETMEVGVVHHAADGIIISANPAAQRILGLTLDQLRGKTSMDPRWRMIKEDGSEVSGADHPAMIALRTGKKIGPVIRGVFYPEKNAYIWLRITAIPLFNPDEDTPFQSYATFEEITEYVTSHATDLPRI